MATADARPLAGVVTLLRVPPARLEWTHRGPEILVAARPDGGVPPSRAFGAGGKAAGEGVEDNTVGDGDFVTDQAEIFESTLNGALLGGSSSVFGRQTAAALSARTAFRGQHAGMIRALITDPAVAIRIAQDQTFGTSRCRRDSSSCCPCGRRWPE